MITVNGWDIYNVRQSPPVDYQQDPDESSDYGIDWSDWLASGETIATSTWVVPDGLTAGAASNTSTVAIQWISGGADGYRYIVTNQITTSAGRSEEHSFTLEIIASIYQRKPAAVLLSASSSLALTLAEAKAHLNLPASGFTTDDTLISSMIVAARQHVEMRAQRDYSVSAPEPVKQAMKLLLDHWYQNRGAVNVGNITTALEFGVDALLSHFEPVSLV